MLSKDCPSMPGAPPFIRQRRQAVHRRPSDTPCRTAHRSGTWVLPSLWHATPSATFGHFRVLVGSSPIPRSLAACCVVLELRPLCSTGITPLHCYCGPLRHPMRPSLSLAGCSLAVTRRHRRGFPCCVGLRANMPSPLPRRDREACRFVPPPSRSGSLCIAAAAFPVTQAGRLPHHPFRGLLGVHSRYGLLAR